MNFSVQDYLKKTLLETQERVRDFQKYADEAKDNRLRNYFREYAESEAEHARRLREFIEG